MSDNQKFVQNQNTTLAGAGASLGATSVILTSLTRNDGTLLTMTDFGSKGFGTIEPGNGSQEESITFTGITQNVDGTATLTGVSTCLTVAPYTETSGLAITHAGGSIFIVSNTAAFYNDLTGKSNDETITGTWTFTSPNYPRMDVTTAPPTDDEQLVTKKYADDLAIAGSPNMTTTVKGIGEEATAAEIDAGTQAGGTGAELIVNPKYLKDSIYKSQLPSSDEKAALAGQSGTAPSVTNKFIDAADVTTTATANKIVRRDSNGQIIGSSPTATGFLAGENISANDPVALSDGTAYARLTLTTDNSAANGPLSGNSWVAQTFVVDAETAALGIKAITVNAAKSGVPAANLIVSIRNVSANVPTGSDIGGYTATVSVSGQDNYTATFATPPTIAPGTYAACFRAAEQFAIYGKNSNVNTGNYASSSDAGSSWTADTNKDLTMVVDIKITTAGKLYKADPRYLYNGNTVSFSVAEKVNCIGFATAAATAGNAVSVQMGGILGGFTGLTAGSDYYVNDSLALSTTQGTHIISLGKAVSTTELFIDRTKRWGSPFYGTNSSPNASFVLKTTYTAYTDLMINYYHTYSSGGGSPFIQVGGVSRAGQTLAGNEAGTLTVIVKKGETWICDYAFVTSYWLTVKPFN